jgi:hypothetical protein
MDRIYYPQIKDMSGLCKLFSFKSELFGPGHFVGLGLGLGLKKS